MNKILADLVAFGRQYLRSKVGAFFTFIFPILLILLFGAIFTQTGTTTISLPVQDADQTGLSTMFLSSLNTTGTVKVTMIPSSENLTQYIKNNTLSVALLIPDGFGQAIINSSRANWTIPVTVVLYGDPTQASFGIATGVLEAVAEQMNFRLIGVPKVVWIQTQQVASDQFSYMDYFLPGIVGMTVMTTSMYSMTSICGEYRSRKYFKLLATTTLKKHEWLTSKILFYIISLTASLLLSVAIGWLAFNIHVTIGVLAFAFIVAGALLFTSLGMIFGTVVKDPESGVAIANAIGFPMMFLSGSFFPLESMPSFLREFAKVLPLTYLNSGLTDAMVYGNVNSALLNLGVVTVLAVVLFVLSAKLVSWKER